MTFVIFHASAMPDIPQRDSIRTVCHSRGNMKASRLLWLVWMILAVVRSVTLGQDAPPQPEATRALLQAKTVYIISGHVRYYKTKGFLKKELVDETPFEEPCRKELEKWGRFTLVPDIKGADLVIRAYEKGGTNYVPVISPGAPGRVNVGLCKSPQLVSPMPRTLPLTPTEPLLDVGNLSVGEKTRFRSSRGYERY